MAGRPYDVGGLAEMYEVPAGLFSANAATETDAIDKLDDLLEDEGEEEKVTYEELILSLGGSKRAGDADSENTVVTLVQKVKGGRKKFSQLTPVLLISGEQIDRSLKDELDEEDIWFKPLHVRVPMKREIVIPAPLEEPKSRTAAIAGHTVNSIAELGKETAESSPFVMKLTEVLKRCNRIYVHNDFWLDGNPYICDNFFFDRTPCILYALKQAVSAGATVIFVNLADKAKRHRCRKHFQYVREGGDEGKEYATWTMDKDVRFIDPWFIKSGGKRTRRSTRRLRRKTKSTSQYK
jgi:hypothetical protein